MVPLITINVPCPAPRAVTAAPVLADHSSVPPPASSAYTSPEPEPSKTRPLTTIGEVEREPSPPKVQSFTPLGTSQPYRVPLYRLNPSFPPVDNRQNAGGSPIFATNVPIELPVVALRMKFPLDGSST